MSMFAYTSDKSRWDRALLDAFSKAVYQLKMEAQGRANARGIARQQLLSTRATLRTILQNLSQRVESLLPSHTSVSGVAPNIPDTRIDDFDADQMAFTGFAFEFLEVNQQDVEDRLDELDRLCKRLADADEPIRERDAELLDRLQTLLEREVAESTHSMYAI